jgi:hypothetical protein
MASTYIYRTPSSTGSNTISTFSGWLKKTVNGSYEGIFTSVYETGEFFEINFETGDSLEVRAKVSSSYVLRKITTRKFRDPAAFYHIVVAIDTTDGTAEDRCKIYVNGVRETSFSTNTNPSQNQNLNMNTAGSYEQRLGRDEWSTPAYFDGVMAHVHWVDGTAYQASTFGETDSTSGIWKPKTAPSVTYGTNGFFFKFENSGNMDLDSSGNNHTFTTGGTLTQNVDTPSNNFTAWNVIMNNTEDGNWSNANLTIAPNGDDTYLYAPITFGLSAGKWYSEHMITGGNGYGMLGAISEDTISDGFRQQTGMGSLSNSFAFRCRDGDIRMSSSNQSYGSAPGTSDAILGMALDMDNKKVWYHINGTYVTYGGGVGNPASGTYGWDFSSLSGDTFFITSGDDTSSGYGNFKSNFGSGFFGTTAVASSNADGAGQGLFEYSVPSGFYSICTKNIKDYG